ncbi:coiled-coil domain-containing protein [Mucisphaera calidilacus]|uniref:Chromosome partition protein Smc n=1 Tax=Mucisphaera calidilacus TaxID=2527982 RepID=A0A518BXD5_9BACT|nr:hypothetical protein [Mucisphaera calidilacus]QDU71625.1 hypothetical protein Pan265_14770 [Mucisphaera calidilacus]
MRFLICLLAMSLMLAATGCEPSGGPDAQNRARLEAALKDFQAANAGYIPQRDQQPGLTLTRYRIEQLSAVRSELQDLSRNGSNSTKAQALRLLSEIEASEARLLSVQGATAFANMAVEAVQTVGLIDTAEIAKARVGLMGNDQDQAAEAMIKLADEFEQKARQAGQQAATTERERDRLAAERERVRKVYEESIAEQVELTNQSGIATGDEKYALLERAAEASHRANLATTETERFDSQVFAVETQAARARAEQRGYTETAKALRVRAADTQKLESEREAAEKASVQIARDAVDRLLAAGSAVVERYENEVSPQLINAVTKAQKAVDHLQQARRLAGRDQQQAIDFEILAKQAELVHAVSVRVQTLASFRSMLDPVQAALARAGQPDQDVAAAIQAIDERTATALDEIKPSLDDASELGTQLAERFAEDTLEGRRLRRQIARIEGYAGRLGS